MTSNKRYTAAYLGALFPDMLASEKEEVIACNNGEAPDRWFVDLEEGRAEFKALLAEVAEGRVHKVVMLNRIVLPDDTNLVGEFFDALLETDTEWDYVARGTTNPTEKFMAQLVPLLHEWSNGEAAHFAARGWYTLHADTQDILWLRVFLHRSGTPQAKRWLERLLPQLGETVVDQPAGKSLASIEIANKRYAVDRVADIIDFGPDTDAAEILDILGKDAEEAERTLKEEATAQEEADRDEYVAMWLRRRAEHFDDPSGDLGEFDRKVRATVLREEAELLDRRWKRLEGPAGG